MDLQELRQNWEKFGKDDPLWRILSLPGKKGGGWDLQEFFGTGRVEVQEVLEYLAKLHCEPRWGDALDFGCGVGRLSQALADRFAHVVGVDISSSMVEQARRLNSHGERCTYETNARADLSLFPEPRFDLVYSNIVLQHISPRYARRYLQEFVRVLRPGGVLVFQLPIRRRFVPGGSVRATARRLFEMLTPQSVLYAYHRVRYHDAPFGLMYGAPTSEVVGVLRSAGGEVVKVQEFEGGQWTNARYVVRKPAAAGP